VTGFAFALCVRFSAALETAANDLCGTASPNISLFTLTPSVRASGSIATEGAFIPNVEHTSDRAFAMLRFVGKLMGLAMRYKNPLPFEFHDVVWKLLVNEPLKLEDLVAIDGEVGTELQRMVSTTGSPEVGLYSVG
jgi:hypothetical protein